MSVTRQLFDAVVRAADSRQIELIQLVGRESGQLPCSYQRCLSEIAKRCSKLDPIMDENWDVAGYRSNNAAGDDLVDEIEAIRGDIKHLRLNPCRNCLSCLYAKLNDDEVLLLGFFRHRLRNIEAWHGRTGWELD